VACPYKLALLLRSWLFLMWGGLDARALFVALSIPLPSSETAACLQQSSIYDWAQSKRSERGRWDGSGVDHSFVISS